MEYKDYYKILGISKSASQDEIKKAYRKQARKFHPDVSKEANAEESFKEAGEAYEVLKDPEKRAAYDQLGSNWKAGSQGFQPPPDWGTGFEFHGGGSQHGNSAGGAGDFSDFFESLFGRGGFSSQGRPSGRAQQAQGDNSHAKVLIDLEDAYHGAERSLSLRSTEMNAQGRPELKTRTLKVKIPKGVKEGQQIRLRGQGTPGQGGGKAGDLFLELAFNPHSIYKVEGHDVSMVLPIAPWEAALGTTINVPTPSTHVDVKIPKGVSSGKKMRLKGLGIPGKTAGDFYIRLEIVLPENLSEKELELYQALEKHAKESEDGFNPRERLSAYH